MLLTQITNEEHEGTLAKTISGRFDASTGVLPYKMMRSLIFHGLVLYDTQRTALS